MMDQSVLILVVDDEPPIVDLLRRVAKNHFSEAAFISADSPKKTLQYLGDNQRPKPQLILLDIDLHTVVDGFDLLPQIHERTKKLVPVIMFSESDAQPNVERAYAEGAVAYTRKPSDLAGWEAYVKLLRDYWFRTSILPGTAEP